MGKGDDAIGYIERDGKVFTLPVTQGKYHEMMQEVAKNQGMNVDISQTVEMPEKQAQDRVITPEKIGEELVQEAKTDTKAALKPAEKRVLADKPEQPRNMTLIDELRSVADGTKNTNGNLVPSKVVDEVQKLRRNIEDKKSQSQVAKSQSQSRKVGHATGMSADNSKGRG